MTNETKHTPRRLKFSFEPVDPEWAAAGGYEVANVNAAQRGEANAERNAETDTLRAQVATRDGDIRKMDAYNSEMRAENARLREALRCVARGKPYAKRAADLLRELGEPS